MKRHWIEYQESQPDCPMTFWVHRPADIRDWWRAREFNPPRQPVVPARGYPVLKIEFDGFTFEFASLDEIRACIETLGRKLLPRTIDLANKGYTWNATGGGPNSHWLSRLPKEVKPWKYREKAVAYMRESLEIFEREIG